MIKEQLFEQRSVLCRDIQIGCLGKNIATIFERITKPGILRIPSERGEFWWQSGTVFLREVANIEEIYTCYVTMN